MRCAASSAGLVRTQNSPVCCLMALSDSCQLEIETGYLPGAEIGRAEQTVEITEGISQFLRSASVNGIQLCTLFSPDL